MSTETLKKIIKEVHALTPQERRELIDRLAQEGQALPDQTAREQEATVKDTAPDFEDSALSNLDTHEDAADIATLREWLSDARRIRAELPLTSDSVDELRELRKVRSIPDDLRRYVSRDCKIEPV